MTNHVYLALGSNLGDREKYIEKAILLLKDKLKNIAVAPMYESTPVGFMKQNNFYNSALQATTTLTPQKLLYFIKSIEIELGRQKRFTNGPREIDIDIILYNDTCIKTEELTIPHPRMHERDFVLQPLTDIAPEIIHPLFKKTVKELRDMLSEENKSILRILNQ